ncbi:MAG: hypothetical protein NTU44_12470 [Bacteroidetes bacterium]|nr:hypothetical protein [Bacteroidota bacterium]
MLKRRNYLPLFVLGLTSMTTQVLLLRHFLDAFSGNELIIGIFLANWMFLTGAGAWLARKFPGVFSSPSRLNLAFILLGTLPIVTLILLELGRIAIFPPGALVGFYQVLIFSFVIQLPFCLLSGWLFPTLVDKIKEPTEDTPAYAYLWESLGSFAGVLVFTVILLCFSLTVNILYLVLIINLFLAYYISKEQNNKKLRNIDLIVWGVITFLLTSSNPDKTLTRYRYKGQHVLEQKESPYGKLVVTESGGQKNFYENGLPLFSGNDAISREESVHYAMLQPEAPQKVLLISGGLSGQINEILKYPSVESIDYLELNSELIKLGQKYQLISKDPRVRVIPGDARHYLKESHEKYDIVLVQLADPVTAQLNRYYTYEFFRELLKNLSSQAVVSISLRSTADYVNSISRQTNSVIYNSLILSFKNVLIIPGNRNYFLASDATLSLKIGELADKRKITTDYVNSSYLQDDLMEQRSNLILSKMDSTAGLNRDFHPRAYLHETSLYLLAFNTHWIIPAGVVLILLVIYLIRIRRARISLFVTGFTASALSFMMMMAFQAIYGYVYLMAGVFISLFMLGAAGGCWVYPLLWKRNLAPGPAWVQVYLGGFVILVMMFLLGYREVFHSDFLILIIFLLMSMLSGSLTGMQFSAVAALEDTPPGRMTSDIYSAEMIGSALGVLAVATLLFPLVGLVWVCLGLGLVNFVIGFMMFE